jgi:plastocyanin
MQSLLSTRTAADVNLVAQLLLLAGLILGFVYARQKRFDRHANVQTAMVLLNLAFIAAFMVPSFYGYVVAGGSTTGTIAQLMIAHGILGLVVEAIAIYLILRMRTNLIPRALRIRNIKAAMRATLALWATLVVLGLGIYGERYLNQSTVASAPLLELRQLGADLYVHAVELQDAVDRRSLPAVKRHAEHLINLVEGEEGLRYGDNDADGRLEDPGDGVGLLARVDAVAAIAADAAVTAEAELVRADVDRIITLSVALLGARSVDDVSGPVAEIVALAQRANGVGIFDIDRAARAVGVVEAQRPETTDSLGGPGEVTVREDRFLFLPSALTVPTGTTVTWINDERAKHTATADDTSFDSGDQNLGDRYSVTLSQPGVYPYFCRYHGDVGGVGMAGIITVE